MASSFTWETQKLRVFNALINLLSLRNGRQLELKCVNQSAPFVNDPHRQIKQRFLDRFAEVISNQRGAEHVACTIMRESGDHVVIWVARNGGFRVKDISFLEKFSAEMCALAARNVDGSGASLWNLLLNYYLPRLQDYRGRLLKKVQEHRQTLSLIDNNEFRHSLNLFFDILEQPCGTNEFGRLCCQALQIQKIPLAQNLVQIKSKSGNQLWKSIGFLARLWRAHCTFLKILRIPLIFRSITVLPITKSRNEIISIHSPLTLSDTLRLFDIRPLNQITVRRYISPTCSVEKAQQKFDERQKQSLQVHAELQIILHLAQSRVTIENLFQYMGCSKRSCFLCKAFLNSFGSIETRGCHGKLYNQWSIPGIQRIELTMKERLEDTVSRMRDILLQELRMPLQTLAALAESSNGTTPASSSAASILIPERPSKKMKVQKKKFDTTHMRKINWLLRYDCPMVTKFLALTAYSRPAAQPVPPISCVIDIFRRENTISSASGEAESARAILLRLISPLST
ncbi:hypothetical protein F5050DRAFT_1839842 [Lentinula boryana]|uniref:Uncharacterized protein n=1 Tax=Lentinula boryana TaxID=40481 RepID=A0ABQ8QPB7_9AGAR|nr:hypothetical protein F5050DRAFT_1839842 [Lentinula boryana]